MRASGRFGGWRQAHVHLDLLDTLRGAGRDGRASFSGHIKASPIEGPRLEDRGRVDRGGWRIVGGLASHEGRRTWCRIVRLASPCIVLPFADIEIFWTLVVFRDVGLARMQSRGGFEEIILLRLCPLAVMYMG